MAAIRKCTEPVNSKERMDASHLNDANITKAKASLGEAPSIGRMQLLARRGLNRLRLVRDGDADGIKATPTLGHHFRLQPIIGWPP